MNEPQPTTQQTNIFPNVPAWLRRLLPISLMLILLGIAAWLSRPDGYLHVWFLDTPGDAFLIQTPQGRYVLIDGGSDPVQLALFLGQHMPFWRRSLDLVILSQADGDRLPGQVAALMRYHARLVLSPPDFLPNPRSVEQPDRAVTLAGFAGEWQRLVLAESIPVYVPTQVEQLVLDGVTLTITPISADDSVPGLLLRLNYGTTSVLFAGVDGAGDSIHADFNGSPLTLLAYPWQREMDRDTWQPQAIVFTTAYQADEPPLHTYYERALHGAKLYHEELDGTIELRSNGHRASIVTHH